MSKNKIGFFHRAVDSVELLVYAPTAIAGAALTITLGAAFFTFAATARVTGKPIAMFTCALTFGAASATSFCANKAEHKAYHVIGKQHVDISDEAAINTFQLGHVQFKNRQK